MDNAKVRVAEAFMVIEAWRLLVGVKNDYQRYFRSQEDHRRNMSMFLSMGGGWSNLPPVSHRRMIPAFLRARARRMFG